MKRIACRHGIWDPSFYRRTSMCGGMEATDARRLKVLEAENAKLKACPTEADLDNAALIALRSDGCEMRSAESGEVSRQAKSGFAFGGGAWPEPAPGRTAGPVAATGRITAAQLDWRINWLDRRIDRGLVDGRCRDGTVVKQA